MDAIADELSEQYDIAVMAVHTEHLNAKITFPALPHPGGMCGHDETSPKGSRSMFGAADGLLCRNGTISYVQQSGVDIGLQVPTIAP